MISVECACRGLTASRVAKSLPANHVKVSRSLGDLGREDAIQNQRGNELADWRHHRYRTNCPDGSCGSAGGCYTEMASRRASRTPPNAPFLMMR